MTSTQRYLRCAVAVAIALMARDAAAQTIEFLTGDAALGPIVRGVPYSRRRRDQSDTDARRWHTDRAHGEIEVLS